MPIETTTFFLAFILLICSYTSWEGATAPPGESTRRTTALTPSSFSYLRNSFTTASPSTPFSLSPMAPLASTMATRAPVVAHSSSSPAPFITE